MSEYDAIIGLEIHVQLKTKSKMFCSCDNSGEEQPPNTTICPICMGHPGTLPVVNKEAVLWGAKTALSLNCEIPVESKFDRKHYFYPDLPKGYQISQFDQPIGVKGKVNITREDGSTKEIRIHRLHLEEDAAKLIHSDKGSFVDYNRAGTPLMEIVTEPDISSPEEAKIFMQELRAIVRCLNVSDADMEKGHLRCDVNISLRPRDIEDQRLFPKTEIKNVNSFRAVERALKYEIARQTELWNKNDAPQITTTRGWNDSEQRTEDQRSKEDSADYHYFPEPDIPPLLFGYNINEQEKKHDVIDLRNIESSLPELPPQKRQRFMEEYGLSGADLNVILYDNELAGYLEQVISELRDWVSNSPKLDWDKDKSKLIQSATGWLSSKLLKLLTDKKTAIEQCKINPENFAELIKMLYQHEINSSVGQKTMQIMLETGGDPSNIVDDNNWRQVSDSSELLRAVRQAIKENPDPVADYRKGKENSLQFLLGQVMRISGGKANPQTVIEILKQELS